MSMTGRRSPKSKSARRFPTLYRRRRGEPRTIGSSRARLKNFEEAVSHLAATHSRNTTDAEISYYLGIAYEGIGREKDAVDAYHEAMRLPSHRAAAALRLAEVQARRGALQQAKDFLTKSLQSAP